MFIRRTIKKRFNKSLTSDAGLLLTKTESREMSSVTGLTSNLLDCTPSVMNSSKWTQMRIQICKSRKKTSRVGRYSHRQRGKVSTWDLRLRIGTSEKRHRGKGLDKRGGETGPVGSPARRFSVTLGDEDFFTANLSEVVTTLKDYDDARRWHDQTLHACDETCAAAKRNATGPRRKTHRAPVKPCLDVPVHERKACPERLLFVHGAQ